MIQSVMQILYINNNQFVEKLQPTMTSHTYKPKAIKCFNLTVGPGHDNSYNFSIE